MSDFDPNDGIPSETRPETRRGRHPDWTEEAIAECRLFDLRKIKPDRPCWARPPSAWKIMAKGFVHGTSFKLEGVRLEYDASDEDLFSLVGYLPEGVHVEIQLVPLSETEGAGERVSSQKIREIPNDFPIRAWQVAAEASYHTQVREHLQWRRDNDGKFAWKDGTVGDFPENGEPVDSMPDDRDRRDDRWRDDRWHDDRPARGYGGPIHGPGYGPPAQGYMGPGGYPQTGYGGPQGQMPWNGAPGYPPQAVPPPPPPPGSPVPHIPGAVYGPVIPPTSTPSIQMRGHYLCGSAWLPVPPGFEAIPPMPPAAPGATATPAASAVGLQPNGDRIFPNGLILHSDGSRTLPDGTIVTPQGLKLRPDGTPIEDPKPQPQAPTALDPSAIITAISSAVTAALPLIRPPAPNGEAEAARVKAESDLKLKMMELEQARIRADEEARRAAEAARIAREEQDRKDRREKEEKEAAERRARDEREASERKAREEREAAERRADKKERDEAAWRSMMFASGFIVGPDGSMRPIKEPRDDKDRDATAALLREMIAKMERNAERGGKREGGELEQLVKLKGLLEQLSGGNNGGGGGNAESGTLSLVKTVIEGLSGPAANLSESLKERVATQKTQAETQKIQVENVAVTEAAALERQRAIAAEAQARAAEAQARVAEAQLALERARLSGHAPAQPTMQPQLGPPQMQPWTQPQGPVPPPAWAPTPWPQQPAAWQQPPPVAPQPPTWQPEPVQQPDAGPLAPPPSGASWSEPQAEDPDPEPDDTDGQGGEGEGEGGYDDTLSESDDQPDDEPEAEEPEEPAPVMELAALPAPEPDAPAPEAQPDPVASQGPETLMLPFTVPVPPSS